MREKLLYNCGMIRPSLTLTPSNTQSVVPSVHRPSHLTPMRMKHFNGVKLLPGDPQLVGRCKSSLTGQVIKLKLWSHLNFTDLASDSS